MQLIELEKGYSTIVSDSVFDQVNSHQWHLFAKSAVAIINEEPTFLAEFLLGANLREIFFLDLNPLNNSFDNIVIVHDEAILQQNCLIKKQQSFRGVSRHKTTLIKNRTHLWGAHLALGSNWHTVGTDYYSAAIAADEYDREARIRWGKYARLNLPVGDELSVHKVDMTSWGLTHPPQDRKPEVESDRRGKHSRGTKYKGIYNHYGRWAARFNYHSKTYYAGYYNSDEKAAIACDLKKLEVIGYKAITNFSLKELATVYLFNKEHPHSNNEISI